VGESRTGKDLKVKEGREGRLVEKNYFKGVPPTPTPKTNNPRRSPRRRPLRSEEKTRKTSSQKSDIPHSGDHPG